MSLTDTARPTTSADLLDGARALAPVLARHAGQGDHDRRLPEEAIGALADGGMFKLAVPRRYGGHEVSVRTLIDVSAALAEGDGSASWLVAVGNSVAWITSLFPEKAQDDVFGANPDAKVSGVLTPSATARRVDGGYRISGRWFYNSGSWHADWAAVGFPIPDEDGQVVDQGLALVPAADYQVEDSWFVAGMRATGSNCLVGEDVFVPLHRVLSVPSAMAGDYPTEYTGESLYRSAFVQYLTATLAGPLLGLGRAALAHVVDKAAHKPVTFTFYEKQRDSAAFQVQIAEAALKIDTAHLHAHRAADDIDLAAARGELLDPVIRLRVRADISRAVEQVTEAIGLLVTAHGASGFAETSPLQRIWRDANVGARHAILQPTVLKEMYGKALLGVDEQISPLV